MSVAVDKYRELLTAHGEVVTFKRVVVNQPEQVLGTARVRIMGYTPAEIAAGIDAGRRRVIVLAEDVANYNPPLRKNDRMVTGSGVVYTIQYVDTNTRKDGDTILAYELQVSGA